MKTIYISIVLLALFQACKKMPFPAGGKLPTLIGLWQRQTYTVHEYINGVSQPAVSYQDYNPGDYIAFGDNGMGSISILQGTQFQITNFSYSLSGNVLTLYENEIIKQDTLTTFTRDHLTIHDVAFESGPGGNYEYITDSNYLK